MSTPPRQPSDNQQNNDDSSESVRKAIEMLNSSGDGEELHPFFDDAEEVSREDLSESEGEDLFNDDMEKDYESVSELDRYDSADIDMNADDYAPMDPVARRAAEREISRRDKVRRKENQRPDQRLLFGDLSSSMSNVNLNENTITSSNLANAISVAPSGLNTTNFSSKIVTTADSFNDSSFYEKFIAGETDDDEAEPTTLDEAAENMLEDTHGYNIRTWVCLEAPRNEIKRQFTLFLKNFRLDNSKVFVYRQRIVEMCQTNRCSLIVDFEHLNSYSQVLSFFIPEAPTEMLEILNETVMDVVLALFHKYTNVTQQINVRLCNLPLFEDIRSLRQVHLNQLIRVGGVVVSASNIMPQLLLLKFVCEKCRCTLGPFMQNSEQSSEVRPTSCPECQSRGPFTLSTSQCVYRNFQKLRIQEPPSKINAGRLPRSKDVILLGDLVDFCKPGDEIDLTGIYKNAFDNIVNAKNGFPVFATLIEANYISKMQGGGELTTNSENYTELHHQQNNNNFTEEDQKNIIKLSQSANLVENIINSMAPSIYGHHDVKRAIALSLFGGVAKDPPNQKHRIRGDINVLICGDPGTAKSQFLKYTQKVAGRSIYTTGQGASAVGLTAYVMRNPVSKEWTLEAGALVLADRGVCLIDEFDKMNDADRTSIHEAMEQQSISISKAGIVTTLQARCAVIAAANPIGGTYDVAFPFSKNVDLTEPILSRFDVICVVKDDVDLINDERLAKFVVHSHLKHHPFNVNEDNHQQQNIDKGNKQDTIDQGLLKKYIQYAREKIRPKLHHIDKDRIVKMYSELRRESMMTESIPITVRHVESIIRIAEAHAKMHLRENVLDTDVNMALRVVLESFIETQKFSVIKSMKKTFSRYLTYKKDENDILMNILKLLVKETVSRKIDKQLLDSDVDDNFDEVVLNMLGDNDCLEISEQSLIDRARQLNLQLTGSFYKSAAFSSKFVYDKKKKAILYKL